ncbi:MAG: esterase family protein [Acholeplasmataceae bacterium]|nr:MAG: esterase family protein [Acholeplasmataceae bacterium]
MAFMQCHCRSDILERDIEVNVILPRQRPADGIRLLYLFHGYSGNHTNWVRLTSIERYAEQKNLAVVMPDVANSYYADMVHGPAYFTFLAEELPAIIKDIFQLDPLPQHQFVAGLSMGGYGAFKLALTYPDRYAKAASLSGALDAVKIQARFEADGRGALFHSIFADQPITDSPNDLFHLAGILKAKRQHMPDLYLACGTEDFLYDDHRKFRDFLLEHQIKHVCEEGPGEHTWAFWDAYIERVIDWLHQT